MPPEHQDRFERPEVRLNGRAVLVTGAGGSIGSDLARAVAGQGPRRLVLLDRSEPDLVDVCRALDASVPVQPVLGDVCDESLLAEVFGDGIECVLHAAAVKQVPFLETQPLEAIRVNVLGTRAILAASRGGRAGHVVVLSSDKAVAPTSLLGATKRACERMVQAAGPAPTCVAVRSGNVLGSRGSVLPLFDAQIASGGPVLVTDADATRYFATRERTVELVVAATQLGAPGDVLVPDLGPPVSILSLARERIARFGASEGGASVGIRFVGLRPGERRNESLIDDGESLEPTRASWIRRVKGGPPAAAEIETTLDRIARCVASRNAGEAVEALRSLVPEWAPSDALQGALSEKTA